MFAPLFKDFTYAAIEILTQLINPKAQDFPANANHLNVPPMVIQFAGPIRIAMAAVAVHLYVQLDGVITFPDQGQIKAAPYDRILRNGLKLYCQHGLIENLFPGRLMGVPWGRLRCIGPPLARISQILNVLYPTVASPLIIAEDMEHSSGSADGHIE